MPTGSILFEIGKEIMIWLVNRFKIGLVSAPSLLHKHTEWVIREWHMVTARFLC